MATRFLHMSWLCSRLLHTVLPDDVRAPARAAGEHPVALETVGVSTRRMRYLAPGVRCPVRLGAHLALGYLNQFAENMVAGRGFIALAATIFGQGRPLPVFLACVLLVRLIQSPFGFRVSVSRPSSHL